MTQTLRLKRKTSRT